MNLPVERGHTGMQSWVHAEGDEEGHCCYIERRFHFFQISNHRETYIDRTF